LNKLYTVDSVVDRIVPGKAGAFSEEVMISFTTVSGYKGRVSLAKAGLTAEKAQAAVEAEARKFENILAL
jgi:hypothetical protein